MVKRCRKIIAIILMAAFILQLLPATAVRADEKEKGDDTVIDIGASDSEDENYTPYPDAASVSNPNSGMTWDEYFGGVANTGFPMSRMPLVSLVNGYEDYVSHGGYTSATPSLMRYIGTPFAWVQDNVHPGPGGKLNCTAFFTWLVLNMGVSQSEYMAKTSGGGGLYSLRRVTDTFRSLAHSGRIIMYNFPSFEAAMASGKLKKGDIMIMEPADGNSHDHHFTVYWGDTPSQNIVQHSIDSSDCILYRGNTNSGNIISNLPVGSWGRRVWTFPNSVFQFYFTLQKESGSADIADNSEFTITNVREEEVLCVAVVDKNGNIKSIKNKINDDDFKIDLVSVDGRRYIRVMEHEAGSRIYRDTTAMKLTVKQTSSPMGDVAGDESDVIVVGNGLDKAKTISIKESLDYSKVYDYNYYINKYPDIRNAFGNNRTAALNHFITRGMAEGRQASASFNVIAYKNQNNDLRSLYGNDYRKYFIHYIQYGYREGRRATGSTEIKTPITKLFGQEYGAVYDYKYYLDHNPDVKSAFGGDDVAVLQHFINHGMKEGRQAKETFNVGAYKKRYGDLRIAFRNDLPKYYKHFMDHGYREGRLATGNPKFIPVTTMNGTNYSAVYDFYYYLDHNPDVKKAFGNDDVAVLEHFINHGMKEARRAKESFDVKSYRNRYQDLRLAFRNDLPKYYKHYITNGKKEARTCTGVPKLVDPVTKLNGVDYSKVYDFNYYINKYDDIKKAFGYDDVGALEHFVRRGMIERRQGKATFNFDAYRANYDDLRKAFGEDSAKYYMHYIKSGEWERRNAAYTTIYNGVNYKHVFDAKYYADKYPDLKQAFGYDKLLLFNHFVRSGMREGRQASAEFDVRYYRSQNKDLQKAFGSDFTKYYRHYEVSGRRENRKGTKSK